MLSDQLWISLAPYMAIEWKQCMEQGLDVEQYELLCREIANKGRECEKPARELATKLHSAPLRPDYPYDEPSDLAGILAARPKRRHLLKPAAPCDMAEKLRGAWLGRISGCLLGKPVEGARRPLLYKLLKGTGNYPMRKYIRRCEFGPAEKELVLTDWRWDRCWADTLNGAAPEDDDTNYTVFALKLLQCYGRDFTPTDVLEGWMRFIPYLSLCTAERVAYRNGAMGLLPPETAVRNNPFREWIGAQIRGDFFGYVNPGDPSAAAEMAWRDASISHVKNGIYGEMFCSAMTAAAAVTDDIRTIVEAGLDEIPANCRLRRGVEQVLAWYGEGLDREAISDKIHGVYDETSNHDWCHTISNAMIVVMALLVGGGNFGKSVCAAVQAAFDTDCNGATVGSILGMRNAGIPEEWIKPFGGRLQTSIQGYGEVTAEQMATLTLEQMKK